MSVSRREKSPSSPASRDRQIFPGLRHHQRRSSAAACSLYVMDEPTTGLHMSDISRLMDIMNRLVDGGNTVVVIEHNLDVIKSADWIIDMGPEGGRRGGQIIFEGTPVQLAAAEHSITGAYLRKAETSLGASS